MADPDSSSTLRLRVGDHLPSFALPDATGRIVTDQQLRGRHLVLYAYPAASTPGCTIEAHDFHAALDRFHAGGYTVVGVSPDPPTKLARFAAAEHLDFPLLSDVDHRLLTALGAFGERTLYGRRVRGVIRSTFTVDSDGVLTGARYNVKATGHVERLLAELGL